VDLTAKRGPGGLATAAADGRTSRQHDAPSSIVYSVGYVFEAPAGPVLRAVTRLAGAATVTGVRAFRVGGTGATMCGSGCGSAHRPLGRRTPFRS
jgi:hypothetical protein